jgi:trk system potassium uptake protein
LRVRRLLGGLGVLLLIYAAAFIVPIIVALFYDGPSGTAPVRVLDLPLGLTWNLPETAILFALIGLGVLVIGASLLRIGMVDDEIRNREAYAIVGLGWLLLAAVGAIPYLLLGALRSPVDAFFESMSGITTTGATVFTPPYSQYAPSLMAWRALQQWIGGLGIVVLMVAVLAGLTHGGMQLMSAQQADRGVERVKPRLVATARAFWRLYLAYTILLTLLLATLMHTTGRGLPLKQALLDGMIHAFTSLSTGGFSNHEESIAYYQSFWVEFALFGAMVAMGISFAIHLLFWSGFSPRALLRGRLRTLMPGLSTWRQVASHAETRFYLGTIVVLGGLVAFSLWYYGDYRTVRNDLWYGFLQTVSILTTTGYNPVPYDDWNEVARFLLFLMFFIGGCAGSTAGGFKMIRIMILSKLLTRQLRLLLHPRALIHVRVGHLELTGDALRVVTVFSFTYLLTFVLGALAYAALGLDILSAAAASASGVGNIGPALGAAHADFHSVPSAGRLVHIVLMWAGRLELFTVLVLLLPETWRR